VRAVALAREEGGGIGEKLPLSMFAKKALISKQTLGHFNKLALADTFE